MENSELAILILSCDKYEDVWDAFFYNFQREWSDCPYKIYLLTNFKKFNKYNVQTICVGEDISWSSNLKKALLEMKEDFLLTSFDDLFFEKAVDTKKVKHLFERFKNDKMNYLKLVSSRSYHLERVDKDNLGIIPKGSMYRSSAVFTIWRKNVLNDILDETENAWGFEIFGSSRTDKYDQWYGSKRDIFSFLNLIIKGKYEPIAYNKLKKNGVKISDTRSLMSNKEAFNNYFRDFRSYVFKTIIPVSMRRHMRQSFDSFQNKGN